MENFDDIQNGGNGVDNNYRDDDDDQINGQADHANQVNGGQNGVNYDMYESDDGFIEFDTIESMQTSRPLKSSSQGVTLSQLQSGIEIDTNPDQVEPDGDEEEERLWWSKEELLKNLELDNPFTSNLNDGDEAPATFEERIPRMECLLEDNVWKRTIKQGYGPLIQRKNAVLFHCNGYIDGIDEPFDSSVLRGRPLLHRLDQENLLPGLMVGLLNMKLHEKAELIIKPKYAFGELGCPPRIPENATLMYIVEVLKIFEEGSLADYELMTPEELAQVPFQDIMAKCNDQRKSGNTYFQGERYKEAALRYRKAIVFLERYTFKNKEEEAEAHAILSKLYPNIAMAYLKLKRVRAAMASCRKALEIDRNNLKALFHYGRAKYMNGDYEQAKELYDRALELDPNNPSVIRGMQKLNQRMRQDALAQQELYRRMASGFFG